MLAAESGNYNVARDLLEEGGANVNRRTHTADSPVFCERNKPSQHGAFVGMQTQTQ